MGGSVHSQNSDGAGQGFFPFFSNYVGSSEGLFPGKQKHKVDPYKCFLTGNFPYGDRLCGLPCSSIILKDAEIVLEII